jgi:hypothetical protein
MNNPITCMGPKSGSQIGVPNRGPKSGSQIGVPNQVLNWGPKSGSQIKVPNQGPKSGHYYLLILVLFIL